MNERREPADIDLRGVYISSIAAMTALFFFGVGVPCWYAFDLGWGLGLGGMAAFWGGPGFGVMAAGAHLALHQDRRVPADRHLLAASGEAGYFLNSGSPPPRTLAMPPSTVIVSPVT